MSITIELTPPEEAELKAHADRTGVSLREYVRALIRMATTVPESRGQAVTAGNQPAVTSEDERIAAIDRVMGKYSSRGGSSEDFMRRKHEDTEREEERWERGGLAAEPPGLTK